MEIAAIQKSDFDEILTRLDQFWGNRQNDVRPLHHPMFVHEFGDTGFVVRQGTEVVAYLLGFILKEKAPGYVHMVGVRQDHRKQGLAAALYARFSENAARSGCTRIKAITTAGNLDSVRFHQALGFELEGDPNSEGVPVIKNYRAPGEDRVVFFKKL